MTEDSIVSLAILFIGIIVTIFGWLINRNIKHLDDRLESHEDELEKHRKAFSERLGALEQKVASEYVTKQDAHLEHIEIMNKLDRIAEHIAKLFDLVADVKEKYVSHKSCDEFRKACGK